MIRVQKSSRSIILISLIFPERYEENLENIGFLEF
jgi:hypothetical protein